MNAMYEMIMAKKRAMEAQAKALDAGLSIKPKYEYDSDEDVDGGTWEHKKREIEMQATKGNIVLPSEIMHSYSRVLQLFEILSSFHSVFSGTLNMLVIDHWDQKSLNCDVKKCAITIIIVMDVMLYPISL